MELHDVFNRLLEFTEQWQRQAPMLGLVFAEVVRVTDEGCELRYLSSTISAPSSPARVASFMAGSHRGAYFMPEPGDEVVVGFEMGDVNRPVVLGALWSDQDRPPPHADGSSTNDIRTITSRRGHQITFDDSDSSSRITIKTSNNMQIVLQDAPIPKITITTTGVIATSTIVLDGVSWNHTHPTFGSPPQSLTVVP